MCLKFQIQAAGTNGEQGEEEETDGLPLHDPTAEKEENTAAFD